MTSMILLDAGPLGMLSHRGGIPEVESCQRWLRSRLALGDEVFVPEIADYEVRRELLRAGKSRGIERLDALNRALEYLPIKTGVMRHAARLWAEVRRQGKPTAHPHALDADVILAAQARDLAKEAIVVTTNVGHLERFVEARSWRDWDEV